MRYYQIYLPGETEPDISTNVRKLHDLPDGTRIEAIVTDRDGDLADSWDVPVVDGKPQISGRGKAAQTYYGLR